MLPDTMQQKYCDQGLIQGAVDDHMTDIFGAQLLRLRREAEERVDLALGEQLLGLGDELMTQSMSRCGSSPT